ncbi:MAG: hypothetical protein K2O45_10610, partial [Oscillospiraceae bacterium]|nr:hypothetical protein [Oscillospiraceae bacterium]
MTRDDLKTFHELDIDFSSIDLDWGGEFVPAFCTPLGAEEVGSIGCDGIQFILLPGDEKVYCVDPAMGDVGTFVLPVAGNFREFLSFVLYCHDADPLSQIYFLSEERFQVFAADEAEARESGELEELFVAKDAALAMIAETFGIAPAEPFHRVKALQAAFDPSVLNFSDEYYDALGLVNPRHPEETVRIYGTATFEVQVIRRKPMLPQDPN